MPTLEKIVICPGTLATWSKMAQNRDLGPPMGVITPKKKSFFLVASMLRKSDFGVFTVQFTVETLYTSNSTKIRRKFPKIHHILLIFFNYSTPTTLKRPLTPLGALRNLVRPEKL